MRPFVIIDKKITNAWSTSDGRHSSETNEGYPCQWLFSRPGIVLGRSRKHWSVAGLPVATFLE